MVSTSKKIRYNKSINYNPPLESHHQKPVRISPSERGKLQPFEIFGRIRTPVPCSLSIFVIHSIQMGWRDMISLCPSPWTLFQGRSGGLVLECQHTIKSHGWTLARNHKHDWLILILLGIIEIILNITHPFYRYVGKEMMTDLRYPLQDNTVPIWSVPVYAVLLPIAIFILYYIRRKDVYDLHNSVLGILFAVLITGVITDSIKNAVGRPRPNFFWRCFPDGVDIYDRLGNVICNGKASEIKEGHKSFPSGHTSWSFAGLGFLALYLSGKIKCFDRRGHVAKLCIVFFPILAACLVGVSRVDDYWHHWQDVFAGGLLGLFVATFCYLQFFPPPYDTEGWNPHAYFRAVEEIRDSNRRAEQPVTEINPQVVPRQGMSQQQSGVNGNTYYNLDSTLDSMESGAR